MIKMQFLFKKRFKKCLKIAGLFIFFICIYILLFIYSEPTIDTDYLSQLNQTNRPENYKPEDDAWPYYQKAFELYIEPNSFNASQIIYNDFENDLSDFNDIEQEFIAEWIEQNQPAWEEFVKASFKPYCYIENEIQEADEDDPLHSLKQILDVPIMKIKVQANDLRELSFLGRWRIKIQAGRANKEQAIEDCFTFLNAAFQWQQDKTIIDEILGLHLNSYGNEGLIKVVFENKLSLKQLEEIQKRLTDIYETQPIILDLDAEKIMFYDLVQHVFTKGGLGGGHLIPKYLSPLTQISSVIITMSELDPEPTTKEKLSYVVISLLHARRNKTIKKYNKIFEQMKEIQSMSPYEQKQTSYSMDIEKPWVFNLKLHLRSFTEQSKYLLVGIYTLPMDRISELIFEKKAEYEATITILALKRYMLENGEYPETLGELLNEGYVSKLPMDPYSSKPLVYKKEGDDFRLYSFGEDFEDNNGKSLIHSNGSITKWGRRSGDKRSDAVFWPVQ